MKVLWKPSANPWHLLDSLLTAPPPTPAVYVTFSCQRKYRTYNSVSQPSEYYFSNLCTLHKWNLKGPLQNAWIRLDVPTCLTGPWSLPESLLQKLCWPLLPVYQPLVRQFADTWPLHESPLKDLLLTRTNFLVVSTAPVYVSPLLTSDIHLPASQKPTCRHLRTPPQPPAETLLTPASPITVHFCLLINLCQSPESPLHWYLVARRQPNSFSIDNWEPPVSPLLVRYKHLTALFQSTWITCVRFKDWTCNYQFQIFNFSHVWCLDETKNVPMRWQRAANFA